MIMDKPGIGKQLSLQSKVFSGLFVLGMSVLNKVFGWDYSAWEIIQYGLFFALLFAPVDISKMLEKLGRRES